MEQQVRNLVRAVRDNENEARRKTPWGDVALTKRVLAIKKKYDDDMKQVRFEARLALKPVVFKDESKTYYIHRRRGPRCRLPREIPFNFTRKDRIKGVSIGIPKGQRYMEYDPKTDTAHITLEHRGVDLVLGTQDDGDDIVVLSHEETPAVDTLSWRTSDD